jgi:hypothetical protein
MARTGNEMVVDEPYGLHMGIADGRADELEAAALEFLRQGIRDRSRDRDF